MDWYIIATSGWGDFNFEVVQADTIEQAVKTVTDKDPTPDEDEDDEDFVAMPDFDIIGDHYAERSIEDDAVYKTVIIPAPSNIWKLYKKY